MDLVDFRGAGGGGPNLTVSLAGSETPPGTAAKYSSWHFPVDKNCGFSTLGVADICRKPSDLHSKTQRFSLSQSPVRSFHGGRNLRVSLAGGPLRSQYEHDPLFWVADGEGVSLVKKIGMAVCFYVVVAGFQLGRAKLLKAMSGLGTYLIT